jgi:hypothetical protein
MEILNKMDLNEATSAYIAAKKLRALYDAYRATSRAHALVLRRIASNTGFGPEIEAQTLKAQRLARRFALARETDILFRVRTGQLDSRILELKDYGIE